MKKIILTLILCATLPFQALAAMPSIVVKNLDELEKLPGSLELGIVEIEENAEASALDVLVPLLQFTPQSAATKWGKPAETYDTGSGKGYTWANGYSLEYNKAGKLRRVLYSVPQDTPLPYKAEVIARWGFVSTIKPDAATTHVIKWKGNGSIKELVLMPRGLAAGAPLDRVQIIMQ